MISQTTKDLLIEDLQNAKEVDDLRIALLRLVHSIPSNEDIVNSIANKLKVANQKL